MDNNTAPNQFFRPVFLSISDSWLQVRARPGLFALIWLVLTLLPCVLIAFLFSGMLSRNLLQFFELLEQMTPEMAAAGEVDPAMMPVLWRVLGIYGAISLLMFLFFVFMSLVLSESVKRFRDRAIPGFMEVLRGSWGVFPSYGVVVLRALGLILVRPLAVMIPGNLLGRWLNMPSLISISMFVGLVLLITGLYSYGLAPFIHVTLGLNGADSCALSHAYHRENKTVVGSLFLILVLIPLLLMLMVGSLLIRSSAGGGSVFLWLFQSVWMYFLVISLINFSMNVFPERASEPSTV